MVRNGFANMLEQWIDLMLVLSSKPFHSMCSPRDGDCQKNRAHEVVQISKPLFFWQSPSRGEHIGVNGFAIAQAVVELRTISSSKFSYSMLSKAVKKYGLRSCSNRQAAIFLIISITWWNMELSANWFCRSQVWCWRRGEQLHTCIRLSHTHKCHCCCTSALCMLAIIVHISTNIVTTAPFQSCTQCVHHLMEIVRKIAACRFEQLRKPLFFDSLG